MCCSWGDRPLGACARIRAGVACPCRDVVLASAPVLRSPARKWVLRSPRHRPPRARRRLRRTPHGSSAPGHHGLALLRPRQAERSAPLNIALAACGRSSSFWRSSPPCPPRSPSALAGSVGPLLRIVDGLSMVNVSSSGVPYTLGDRPPAATTRRRGSGVRLTSTCGSSSPLLRRVSAVVIALTAGPACSPGRDRATCCWTGSGCAGRSADCGGLGVTVVMPASPSGTTIRDREDPRLWRLRGGGMLALGPLSARDCSLF